MELLQLLSQEDLVEMQTVFGEEGLEIDDFVSCFSDVVRKKARAAGTIDTDLLLRWGPEALSNLFLEVDYNADTRVSWEEFTTFCISTALASDEFHSKRGSGFKSYEIVEHSLQFQSRQLKRIVYLPGVERLVASGFTRTTIHEASQTKCISEIPMKGEFLDAAYIPQMLLVCVSTNQNQLQFFDCHAGKLTLRRQLVGERAVTKLFAPPTNHTFSPKLVCGDREGCLRVLGLDRLRTSDDATTAAAAATAAGMPVGGGGGGSSGGGIVKMFRGGPSNNSANGSFIGSSGGGGSGAGAGGMAVSTSTAAAYSQPTVSSLQLVSRHAHTDSITAIDYVAHASISEYITAGLDARILGHDPESLRTVTTYPCLHKRYVRALAVGGLHRLGVACGHENFPTAFALDNNMAAPFVLSDPANPHANTIVSVHIVPNSHQILSTDSGGMIKVWDARQFRCVSTFHTPRIENLPPDQLNSVVSGSIYIESSQRLMTAGKSSHTFQYDTTLTELVAHSEPLVAVAYNATTQTVFTATSKSVRMWSVHTGVAVSNFDGLVDADTDISALSIDVFHGRRFFIGRTDGVFSGHLAITGKQLFNVVVHRGCRVLSCHMVDKRNFVIALANGDVQLYSSESTSSQLQLIVSLASAGGSTAAATAATTTGTAATSIFPALSNAALSSHRRRATSVARRATTTAVSSSAAAATAAAPTSAPRSPTASNASPAATRKGFVNMIGAHFFSAALGLFLACVPSRRNGFFAVDCVGRCAAQINGELYGPQEEVQAITLIQGNLPYGVPVGAELTTHPHCRDASRCPLSLFAASDVHGAVHLWTVRARKLSDDGTQCIMTIRMPKRTAALGLSCVGERYLAGGTESGTVVVWDLFRVVECVARGNAPLYAAGQRAAESSKAGATEERLVIDVCESGRGTGRRSSRRGLSGIGAGAPPPTYLGDILGMQLGSSVVPVSRRTAAPDSAAGGGGPTESNDGNDDAAPTFGRTPTVAFLGVETGAGGINTDSWAFLDALCDHEPPFRVSWVAKGLNNLGFMIPIDETYGLIMATTDTDATVAVFTVDGVIVGNLCQGRTEPENTTNNNAPTAIAGPAFAIGAVDLTFGDGDLGGSASATAQRDTAVAPVASLAHSSQSDAAMRGAKASVGAAALTAVELALKGEAYDFRRLPLWRGRPARGAGAARSSAILRSGVLEVNGDPKASDAGPPQTESLVESSQKGTTGVAVADGRYPDDEGIHLDRWHSGPRDPAVEQRRRRKRRRHQLKHLPLPLMVVPAFEESVPNAVRELVAVEIAARQAKQHPLLARLQMQAEALFSRRRSDAAVVTQGESRNDSTTARRSLSPMPLTPTALPTTVSSSAESKRARWMKLKFGTQLAVTSPAQRQHKQHVAPRQLDITYSLGGTLVGATEVESDNDEASEAHHEGAAGVLSAAAAAAAANAVPRVRGVAVTVDGNASERQKTRGVRVVNTNGDCGPHAVVRTENAGPSDRATATQDPISAQGAGYRSDDAGATAMENSLSLTCRDAQELIGDHNRMKKQRAVACGMLKPNALLRTRSRDAADDGEGGRKTNTGGSASRVPIASFADDHAVGVNTSGDQKRPSPSRGSSEMLLLPESADTGQRSRCRVRSEVGLHGSTPAAALSASQMHFRALPAAMQRERHTAGEPLSERLFPLPAGAMQTAPSPVSPTSSADRSGLWGEGHGATGGDYGSSSGASEGGRVDTHHEPSVRAALEARMRHHRELAARFRRSQKERKMAAQRPPLDDGRRSRRQIAQKQRKPSGVQSPPSRSPHPQSRNGTHASAAECDDVAGRGSPTRPTMLSTAASRTAPATGVGVLLTPWDVRPHDARESETVAPTPPAQPQPQPLGTALSGRDLRAAGRASVFTQSSTTAAALAPATPPWVEYGGFAGSKGRNPTPAHDSRRQPRSAVIDDILAVQRAPVAHHPAPPLPPSSGAQTARGVPKRHGLRG